MKPQFLLAVLLVASFVPVSSADEPDAGGLFDLLRGPMGDACTAPEALPVCAPLGDLFAEATFAADSPVAYAGTAGCDALGVSLEGGCEQWIAHYAGIGAGALGLGVAAADGQVFLGSWACGIDGCSTREGFVVAYDAATGTHAWTARYAGVGDFALGWGVAATDGQVFLGGYGCGNEACSKVEGFVVAYDAAAGGHQWTARYAGVGGGAAGFGVAAADGQVFLGGYGCGNEACSTLEGFVAAYDAATGDHAWKARYAGMGDVAAGFGVAAADGQVFLSGYDCGSDGCSTAEGFVAAYDAATGTGQWAVQTPDLMVLPLGEPVSVADGQVFLAAYDCGSDGCSTAAGFVAAYDAATGDHQWTARYAGIGNGAVGAGVAAADGQVFLGGYGCGSDPCSTVEGFVAAYDAATGTHAWTARYAGMGDVAAGFGVAAADGQVFLSGYDCGSDGCSTAEGFVAAYDAATGTGQWAVQTPDLMVLPLGEPVSVADGQVAAYDCGSDGCSTAAGFVAAYDAATGDHQWTARYAGIGNGAVGAGVAAADGQVFLGGYGCGSDPCSTVEGFVAAYDAATGTHAWTARYAGVGDIAAGFGVAAADGQVFLGGYDCVSDRCSTVEGFVAAYDARGLLGTATSLL